MFLTHSKLRLFPIQNDSYFSLLCEPEIFAEITTRKLPKSSKLDHNLCRYAAHLCNAQDVVEQEPSSFASGDLRGSTIPEPTRFLEPTTFGAPKMSLFENPL